MRPWQHLNKCSSQAKKEIGLFYVLKAIACLTGRIPLFRFHLILAHTECIDFSDFWEATEIWCFANPQIFILIPRLCSVIPSTCPTNHPMPQPPGGRENFWQRKLYRKILKSYFKKIFGFLRLIRWQPFLPPSFSCESKKISRGFFSGFPKNSREFFSRRICHQILLTRIPPY